MTEEARAAAYRLQQQRRVASRRAQMLALRGDPVARAALQARWQPVLNLDSRGGAQGARR